MAESLKEKASKEIEGRRGRLIEVSMAIHEEPELGHQEFKASELLVSELEELGFDVEKGTSGLATAFKAVRRGRGEGPAYSFGWVTTKRQWGSSVVRISGSCTSRSGLYSCQKAWWKCWQ